MTIPARAPVAVAAVLILAGCATAPNSGGALVDLAGDVVGVPTLAAIDPQIGGGSGSGSAAPGIGFAIPSNVVKDIAARTVTITLGQLPGS